MKLAQTEFECLTSPEALAVPEGYKGLYAFHKYWGKKPAEPIAYLISHLCPKDGLVVDPFLGSGVSAIEALRLGRRVVGIDLNPAAVRLTRMLVKPPSKESVERSLSYINGAVREAIDATYRTSSGTTATHYIWQGDKMEHVWRTNGSARTRIKDSPDDHDLRMATELADYRPSQLRTPRFFTNSRINSKAAFDLRSLFTGRALHNIELLLKAIGELPQSSREPMLLSLTAAIGQMSSMVFTITGRGKANGTKSDKIEVGSWVIGFWKPDVHFEVNVWNCFERRVKKLIKALAESPALVDSTLGSISDVCAGVADGAIVNGNCVAELESIPDDSADLVITDPPHGDRIPYLELSELWNVVLDEQPVFESEIVVSNAKERGKTSKEYNESMRQFLRVAGRKLKETGHLVLFFNARTESSWQFFDVFSKTANAAGIGFQGCFPLIYSAGSVVQDNRAGALQSDFGLVFSRSTSVNQRLLDIPSWSSTMPQPSF
jgi:16S rRNA G966 N2-methylase RsmD